MLRRLVGAGAIALACAPLVAGPPQTADWLNCLWMIGYGADHLRRTGLPPGVFNTHELGGVPFPVFYGFLAYPLLSGLALVVGAANALRLAVVGVVALQFVLVRRAVRTGGGDEFLATAAACLTIWTVYPLTNAYTRGAMMEFLGTGLLTCAVCRWFALLDAGAPRARIRAALELGLLYALAAGAHPITALYGFVFLALHAVTAFARGPGRLRLLALVPAGAATVAVLAPWVYAYAALKDVLKIRTSGLHLFPDGIDAWWLRLSPLPLDAWLLSGLVARPGPTPYLDAQVNVPLILLTSGIAWATARRLGCPALWLLVPAVLGVVFLAMSLWSEPYEVLQAAFKMVQFPYRLVTYVNLAALSGVLLALRLGEPPVGRSRRRTALLLAVLGLSAVGLGFKLYPVCGPVPKYRVDPAHLPPFFYGWYDYSAAEHYPPLLLTPESEARTVARARMSVAGAGSREYEPLRITMAEPGYVVVPVQPFPWNAIEVDGRPVPDEQLRVWTPRDPAAVGDWTRPPYLAVPVPDGEHVFVSRFRPPAAWRGLTALSFATLLLWGGCVLVLRVRWGEPRP